MLLQSILATWIITVDAPRLSHYLNLSLPSYSHALSRIVPMHVISLTPPSLSHSLFEQEFSLKICSDASEATSIMCSSSQLSGMSMASSSQSEIEFFGQATRLVTNMLGGPSRKSRVCNWLLLQPIRFVSWTKSRFSASKTIIQMPDNNGAMAVTRDNSPPMITRMTAPMVVIRHSLLSTIFVPTTMLTNTLTIMLLRLPFRLLHSHRL